MLSSRADPDALPHLARRRTGASRCALVIAGPIVLVGLLGCSSQESLRASIEYRQTVVEPVGLDRVVVQRATASSGRSALSSVPTD